MLDIVYVEDGILGVKKDGELVAHMFKGGFWSSWSEAWGLNYDPFTLNVFGDLPATPQAMIEKLEEWN